MGFLANHPLAAGAAATLLLLAPFVLFPPVGFLLLFPVVIITPLPILIVGLEKGPTAALTAALLPALAMMMIQPTGDSFSPLIAGGLIFVQFGAFPLAAVRLIRAGWGVSHVSALAFLLGLAGLAAVFLILGIAGVEIEQSIAAHSASFRDRTIAEWSQIKDLDAHTLAQIRTNLDQIIALWSKLLPMILLTSWFVVQVVNLLLLRLLYRNHTPVRILPENLSAFRLPFLLVWIMVGCGSGALVLGGDFGYFSLNAALFTLAPFFFQGLAIIQSAFSIYKVAFFIRGAFYAALFVYQPDIGILVLLVGLFDNWINIRNWFSKTNKEDHPS